MTISSTTNTVSYTGTGSATSFSVTYVFFGTGTTAEIEVVEVVIATGAETVKSNGSDFTVSGGSGATGTVTAAVAPASTVKWVINRTTTQTQETDYVENDPFPAESHEEALDRLTAVDQEQQRALERTAQLPDGYTGAFDPTLPSIITGSTVLAYNAAATAFEVGPTTVAISGAAAEAAAAAASATSADGSATSAAASAATAANYTGTQSVDLFNGTGSQTAFTLSVAPANGDENNTSVYISGVYQQKNTYAVSGTTLTFSTAPPSGTGNVEVMHMSARAIETPADGSVTYPKFASGLVDIDLSSVSGSDDTIASAKAIKTYVDAQVDTVDTLAETLAIGNTSGGTDLAISAGDDITFTDSSKAIFGAGGDLQIYHNGSNTYINETGTGKLIILATDLTMADTGNAHNYLNAVSGAGVTLYYDNNSKIATTATGVTITGEAIATGFTGALDGVLGGGTPASATVTTFTSNGIDDNADALAITIDSSENVGIGTASPAGAVLHVSGVSNQTIRVENSSNASRLSFVDSGTTADTVLFGSYVGGFQWYTASNLKMTMLSNGRLGIGTSAPASELHVVGDAQITGDATVSSLNGGPIAGFRNRIINGGFDVEEHTDTAIFTSTDGYICDRWTQDAQAAGMAGAITFSGLKGRRRLKLQRTNGETDVGILGVSQNFESANCADMAGKVITLSFTGVKGANYSASSDLLRVNLREGSGQDESCASLGAHASSVATQTQYATLTGSETVHQMQFTINASTTQIAVQLWPTFAGTAGADDSLTLGEIQVEIGDVATPFERRTPSVELALCQRYYQKTYVEGVAVGATSPISQLMAVSVGTAAATTSITWAFTVPMRATPSVVAYSTIGGATGNFRRNAGAADVAVVVYSAGNRSVNFYNNAATTAGDLLFGHADADAEL